MENNRQTSTSRTHHIGVFGSPGENDPKPLPWNQGRQTPRDTRKTAQEALKIANHDLSNIHGVKMDNPQTKPNLLNQGKTESPVQSY